jgi:hypothetical protein
LVVSELGELKTIGAPVPTCVHRKDGVPPGLMRIFAESVVVGFDSEIVRDEGFNVICGA